MNGLTIKKILLVAMLFVSVNSASASGIIARQIAGDELIETFILDNGDLAIVTLDHTGLGYAFSFQLLNGNDTIGIAKESTSILVSHPIKVLVRAHGQTIHVTAVWDNSIVDYAWHIPGSAKIYLPMVR